MAEAKEAKRQVTLDEISYNEEGKIMALVSLIPIVGLIMIFVEKDNQFVRYTGAQYFLVSLLAIIPCIGAALVLVAVVYGLVMILGGKRVDLPVISDLALKLINAV